jgi:hypothetical protein
MIFFVVTRLIKTTKDGKKKNKNYPLRKKVSAASLRRISKRLSGGEVRLESVEVPSLCG